MDVKPSNEDAIDVAFQIKAFETIGRNWEVKFVRCGTFWVMYDKRRVAIATALVSRDPRGSFRGLQVREAMGISVGTSTGSALLFLAVEDGMSFFDTSTMRSPVLFSVTAIDEERGPELVFYPPATRMVPARNGWDALTGNKTTIEGAK